MLGVGGGLSSLTALNGAWNLIFEAMQGKSNKSQHLDEADGEQSVESQN